jgi:hypothetical protein
MRKFGIGLVLAVLVTAQVFGASCKELTVEGKAAFAATHVVNFTHADLTTTSTNGATLTNSTVFTVKGTDMVEFVAMELVRPFEYSGTNTLDSTTVVVGDGTDADFFLASTELNKNGTEVWYKYPPLPSYAITVTTVSNAVFGGTQAVMSATATATGSALGRKVYTGDDTVDFVFTPNSTNYALSDLDIGEVNFYFRLQHK